MHLGIGEEGIVAGVVDHLHRGDAIAADHRSTPPMIMHGIDPTAIVAECPHSGTIDTPMYEQLLDADLVVADLSTSNVNAAYELGVRHALKPQTTIVIAEKEFEFPFDVNHITIRTYQHDGKALDIEEALNFKTQLKEAIEAILKSGKSDSPVYTFLKPLTPPSRGEVEAVAGAAPAAPSESEDNPTLAGLLEQVEAAKKSKGFETAQALLGAARAIAPNDHYIVQQLALVTYKSEKPDKVTALKAAREVLSDLDPMGSNDAETLGLWGAIHKRLWEEEQTLPHLDQSIAAYEKGYRLLNDYYNGINYAYLLNVRASSAEPADAITDFVTAERVRANVVTLCESALDRIRGKQGTEDDQYWILATQAEAAFGMGRADKKDEFMEKAKPLASQGWMLESTQDQSRGDHLTQRRLGDDVHAGAIFRLARALHDARDLPELAPHLVHHAPARDADGVHGQGGEDERNHGADEQADQHIGLREVETRRDPLRRQILDVGGEEHHGGEARRGDGVALGDRLGGVAHGVEGVGDVARTLLTEAPPSRRCRRRCR